MVICTGGTAVQMRAHPWDGSIGVGTRNRKIYVSVKLLEALFASELRSLGTEQRGHETPPLRGGVGAGAGA